MKTAAAAVAFAVLAVGDDPAPLSGVPLERKTGIHLALSAKAPAILDLDSGRSTAIRGIPFTRRGFVRVVGIGSRSAVVITRGRVYGVTGSGAASRLGTGTEAVAASDEGSVWVKRRVHPKQCTLRQVRLDGRQLRPPRSIRCAWTIYSGGSLGLGVSSRRIIDPVTRRTVYKARSRIVAVAGKTVALQAPSSDQLTLVDAVSRVRRQVTDPETGGRLYRTAVGEQFLALAFGNPSWTSEGRYPDDQYFDAWVVDTKSARLTRLPRMPAFVALKFTNMAWTDDGRLALLARSGGKYVVALWKAGQDRLELKAVRLPTLASGSIPTFAQVG